MDTELKSQLVKSVKNIKNKLKLMRQNEEDYEFKNKKMFKPLSDPLETLVSKCNVVQKYNDENLTLDTRADFENKQNDDVIPQCATPTNYMAKPKSPQITDNVLKVPNKSFSVSFGVRNDGENLMIGNSPITIKSHGENSPNKMTMINLADKSYELTPGLQELLFQSKPNSSIVDEKDKLIYKDILIHTNAHKRGFSPSGQIQGNSGMKYCNFIKPLFNDPSQKEGGSLPTLKKYKSDIDFVYWDDANELIDRLKILIASKNAGNTNHDNEIISIIEELREAGVIKE